MVETPAPLSCGVQARVGPLQPERHATSASAARRPPRGDARIASDPVDRVAGASLECQRRSPRPQRLNHGRAAILHDDVIRCPRDGQRARRRRRPSPAACVVSPAAPSVARPRPPPRPEIIRDTQLEAKGLSAKHPADVGDPMVSAPSRQALGCPACGGSFVVHLFFSDFADESHKPGRCPWCGHHGTAPTGTIATPASFIARGPATADGDLARALSSTCPGCGAFIVDDETSCPGCGSAYAHPRAGSPGGHPARTQETAHDSFALERRAWQQRLTEPDRLKLAYTADCGHLTVLGDGSAELREREDTMYSRDRSGALPLSRSGSGVGACGAGAHDASRSCS